jgi:hypothetical protein
MSLRDASTPSCTVNRIKMSIQHKDYYNLRMWPHLRGMPDRIISMALWPLNRPWGNAPVPWLVRTPSTVLSRHPQR